LVQEAKWTVIILVDKRHELSLALVNGEYLIGKWSFDRKNVLPLQF